MYGGNFSRNTSGGTRPGSVLRADIPVTLGLITVNVLTFLFGFFTMRAPDSPLRFVVFDTASALTRPWTLLTWPLVAPVDLLSLLCGGLWAWWVCGSLERSWGTKACLGFLAATSALTALTVWGGSLLLQAPALLMGLWLAVAAPTVAWCHINRRERICLYGIITIPAPILAWLTVAFVWFRISIIAGHPLMGLFALSGCAAAYGWVNGGRDLLRRRRAARSPNTRFDNFDREMREGASANPLTRWKEEKERQERDRKLAEMFRRSGYDDDRK